MWKAPRTNAIPGTIFYRIYYQHSNENMIYKNASSATVYNLTGLIPAKTYTIYVTAVNKFLRVTLLIRSIKQQELEVGNKDILLEGKCILHLNYSIADIH